MSASQAVSDVITGIGRMSPQILDNLGIVGATKAIDDYAKSLGKTSEQLTDVERKQALVNVVLAGASGPTVVDDAAAAFERMDAALQNSKGSVGATLRSGRGGDCGRTSRRRQRPPRRQCSGPMRKCRPT